MKCRQFFSGDIFFCKNVLCALFPGVYEFKPGENLIVLMYYICVTKKQKENI